MKTVPLWLILLLDFFAGSNFGVATSNLSTQIIKFYSRNGELFEYDDSLVQSLLSVAVLVGQFIGSMIVSTASATFGRKQVSIVCAVTGVIFNCLCCISTYWEYLMVMRLCVGIPTAALTTTVPAWLADMATTQQRGLLNVLFQLFVCFGILLSSIVLLIIGNQQQFYWLSFAVTAVICLLLTVILAFIPQGESQGEDDETQREISYKQLFTGACYRKSLITALLLGVCAQGTGINSVIVYATLSFENVFGGVSASGQSAVYGSLLVSGINMATTIMALPLVNKLGRRHMWFGGCGICLIGQVLLIITYALAADQQSPNIAIFIPSTIIYMVGFAAFIGPVYFVLVGEVFPTAARGKLNSICFSCNWTSNIIVVLIFPFFKQCVWAAYIVYLILMSVPAVALWFTVPETKGKSLEEINELVCGVQYKMIADENAETNEYISQNGNAE